MKIKNLKEIDIQACLSIFYQLFSQQLAKITYFIVYQYSTIWYISILFYSAKAKTIICYSSTVENSKISRIWARY